MDKVEKIQAHMENEEIAETLDACNDFHTLMRNRLRLAFEAGKRGWWRDEESTFYFKARLRENADKGQWVDVANYAMMLYWKEKHWEDARGEEDSTEEEQV